MFVIGHICSIITILYVIAALNEDDRKLRVTYFSITLIWFMLTLLVAIIKELINE
jgi:hypothetical protein